MLTIIMQGLGRMDVQLLSEPLDSPPSDASDVDYFAHLEQFNLHITTAYLWVLGAYELVRTLHQIARDRNLFDGANQERIGNVKECFNRLRVPLAKLEAARARAGSDPSYAWPNHHEEFGIGWRLGTDVIRRRDLADALLDLVESLSEPSADQEV